MRNPNVPAADGDIVPALADVALDPAPISVLYDTALPDPLRTRDRHGRPIDGPAREFLESAVETLARTIAGSAWPFELALLRAEIEPTRGIGVGLDVPGLASELSQLGSPLQDESREADTPTDVVAWIRRRPETDPYVVLSIKSETWRPPETLPAPLSEAQVAWQRIAHDHLLPWCRDSGVRQLWLRAPLSEAVLATH
mgnify:CR=1 FL=1